MKVGLVSTQFAVNYGAILQAYALRQAIENLKYDCELLDYRPTNRVDGRRLVYRINGLKSAVYSLLMFLNFSFKKNNEKKIQKFDNFLNKHCRLSKNEYRTYSELRNDSACYDALVCGSDQIWNPRLFDDRTFFLDFKVSAPETKLIAYAPSVAENLSEIEWQKLAENVRHLDRLSMREKESAKRLSDVLDRHVETTLDPVFLLHKNDWIKVEEPVTVPGPYILSYELVSNQRYHRMVLMIKERYGLDVININLKPFEKIKATNTFSQLSPENFVWLFRNAEFVCTSSFHGTAFSILMEKQFLSAPATFRASRIENILEQLDLLDRLVQDDDDISRKVSHPPIDYDSTRLILQKLRDDSICYLSKSLES